MKALILAAGYGTRLRPLTNTTPKILLPIKNKPLLSYHLEKLKKAGIKEVLINTHWLGNQIESYSKNFSDNTLKITLFPEKQLLGSLGTMWANKDFFKGEEDFLVIYGDIFSDIDYSKLLKFHHQKGGLLTMVCHQPPTIEGRGIVVAEASGEIKMFKEKPKKEEIFSNLVNGGIYAINHEIFRNIEPIFKKVTEPDFAKDLFPFLIKNRFPFYCYNFKGFLIDIGTLDNYQLINQL